MSSLIARYPYFAGGSLGWHDFIAGTARLMRNDPDYRVPVKADPDIVISHIRESHELLARVVCIFLSFKSKSWFLRLHGHP